MNPNTPLFIVTILDVIEIVVLLMAADVISHIGGTVYHATGVVLRFIALEIVFAGIAVYLPHNVMYSSVKGIGRAIAIIAVVIFYRKLTTFKVV